MLNLSKDLPKVMTKLTFAVLISVLLLTVCISFARMASQEISVEVGPAHIQQVPPGQIIVYHHILTNTGTSTETFSVEVLSTQNWPVELLGTAYPTGTLLLPITVSPQMTVPFQVSLTIPSGVAGVTEITMITATSQISPTVLDTTTDTSIVSNRVYLPLVLRRWPPIPYQPSLNEVQGADDGEYTISWAELPSRLADTYILQEATDSAFTTNLREVCTTAQQSCSVDEKLAGTYYYRVRGRNGWGYSEWSNIQSTTVLLPGVPTLSAIDNLDGDRSYNVAWSATARATSYILQEATDSAFSNPITQYSGLQQSWSASNQPYGTYYYRVAAVGPTGQSGWSNVQSVNVPAPPPDVIVLSSNAFVPYSGSSSWYIVGEALNNTGSNVEFVRINATLRDSSGSVVGSDYSYSMIDRLSPDMTSPFRVIFWDPPAWDSYELVVTWDTTSRQPYSVEVLNSTSYFDSYDAYHVVGEIRNQYGEQRTFVKAFVTLYDANGEVIGVDYSYTNPNELAPGQTASFDTEVYFWKHKPNRSEVADHLLQVYDD